MDWDNEFFVKVYTRDTGEWMMLSWDAKSLFLHLLRKVDKSGVLQLGKHGKHALPSALGHREETARILSALEELLADGCVGVGLTEDRLVIPNFMDAQKARMSDRLRQQRARDNRREQAIQIVSQHTIASQNVTERHTTSHNITQRHNRVTPRIEENRIEERREGENTFFPIGKQSEARQDHPSLFQNAPESHQEALLDPDPVQTAQPAQKAPPKRKQAAKRPPNEPTNGSRIWQAYADAYLAHFGVAPIRDQEANAICARIAKKMPADATEACLVASFYVGHPHELAKVSAYPIGLLLKYWSKYRTECLTANPVTYRQASGSNPSGGFLELARKREAEDRQLARPTEQRRIT